MATKEAKPASAQAAEVPVPKSKKKKLLLIFGAAVLLLGGGAGAWYALGFSGPALTPEQQQEAAAQEKKKTPPIFVTLDPFVVNLRGGDTDHYLQLGVVLQVSDEHAIDAVKQQMPRIRNAVLLLLSSKSAEDLSSMEGKKKLGDEIVTEARKPMQLDGPDKGIEGVYFSAFVIQ